MQGRNKVLKGLGDRLTEEENEELWREAQMKKRQSETEKETLFHLNS